MLRALHIVERNVRVYRRGWRRSVALTLAQPVMFLAAMGLGLGALVDRGTAALPGGVSYLSFLAPGLLAATCMQTACFESSFPVNGRLNWHGSYQAIAATPMRVLDIVVGELAWVGVRLAMVASAFALVSILFGAAHGWLFLAAIPSGVLTGLAFAAPMLAYTGTLTKSGNYNAIFRFVITPLFLFSGVYFPVARMPVWLQHTAMATPLYHGVELARGLALATLSIQAAMVHLAYLATLVAAGIVVATWTFTRKLKP